MHKIFIFFAALFGLIAVIMGAISSHGLTQDISEIAKLLCEQCKLTTEGADLLSKGSRYQFYHVAALFGVGILSTFHRNQESTSLKLSGFFFILGIILFSGSLYTLAFTGMDVFTKAVPFGGISFILGWFFLLIYSMKNQHV